MNNNQMLVQQEVNPIMIIDGIKLDRVQQSMEKIHQFQRVIQNTLVEGHDYGQAFYGASKPSLLKPGAEKILMLLGLTSEYEIIEKIQDYEEGFFAYTVRCVLKKNGMVITEGLGHCNSKEKKYESDKQDKYMLGNTCLKMAKKRAQVDAALTVGSLSDIFTQDLEDMDLEGEQITTQKKVYTDQDGTISKAQAKRIFAIAEGNQDIVRTVIEKYGYKGTSEIKKIDYAKICSEVEAEVKKFYEGTPFEE